MAFRILILWGCFFLFSAFSPAQNCDGFVDEDGDGFFSDVPSTCSTYDPDDSDACIPSQTSSVCLCGYDVEISPIIYPEGFCCESGSPIALNADIISDMPIDYQSLTFQWEMTPNGFVWIGVPTGGSFYSGANSQTLYIPETTGMCGYSFRVVVNNGNCPVASQIFTFVESYPPTIQSTSLCSASFGDCEKACSNSTVTYSVDKEHYQSALWQIEGAEYFSISDGQAEVTWGDEGQGEVYMNIVPDSIADWELDCGEGILIDPLAGNDFKFAYINVSNNVSAPFEYSVDGGTSFTAFNINGIPSNTLSTTATDALPEGFHTITVNDSQGNSKSCQVEIKPIDEIPFTPFVNVFTNGENCDNLSNGSIKIRGGYSVSGGSWQYSIEVTITNLMTGETESQVGNLDLWGGPNSPSFNLPLGNYQAEIQDLTTGEIVTKTFSLSCLKCNLSTSLCIDIQPEPEASFSTNHGNNTNNLSICQGQSIQFENESSGSTSIVWDFGNGATTPAENPEYIYPEAGNYEVKLIARNDCFCADTTTMMVEVSDAIIPDIQCTGTVCEGDTATYSTSVNCNFYQWQISPNGQVIAGGSADDDFVTVAWAAGPDGFVQLQTNGCAGNICPDPVQEIIGIMPSQVWAEGPQNVCPHQITEYSIPDFGATTYTWYVPTNMATILSGQGTPSITVEWGEHPGGTTPELAQIEVEYENCFLGCSGQGTISVQLKQPSYLTGPIEVCYGDSPEYEVELFNGNGNGEGQWQIVSESGGIVWQSNQASGQISPVWDFPAGRYIVNLISTSNASCSDEAGLNVTLLPPPPPVEDINGDDLICPNLWYSYEAESNVSDAIFTWQIVNGNNFTEKTGKTINVEWGTLPPYQVAVSQIVGGASGCPSEFIVKEIKELPEFEVDGPMAICKGQTAIYSTENVQNIDYEWIIEPNDAGGILNGQGTNTVGIVWQKAGAATLTLMACGDNVPIQVEVFALPEPETVIPEALCPGDVAEVSVTSNFDFYQWENENGGLESNLANPDLGVGQYSLFVSDHNGCMGETSFLIEEKPSPEVGLSSPDRELCLPEPAILYALETEDGLSFEWFHNGNSIGSDMPTYEATELGIYSIVATDGEGCTSSASLPIVFVCDTTSTGGGGGSGGGGGGAFCVPIEPLEYSYNSPNDCAVVDFNTTTASVLPGTLTWEFFDLDGTSMGISYDEVTSFTYPNAGYFHFQLLAAMPSVGAPNNACPTVVSGSVAIPLKAHFSAVESCPGLPVDFTDASTFLPTTNINSWSWNFGEPSSGANNFSSEQHPSHVYSQAGIYTVELTVTSSDGCTSMTTETIEVHAAPTVDFEVPTVNCAATALEFSAQVSANTTQLEWDFGDPTSGDGNTSNEAIAWHAYPIDSDYEVTLTAENIYGCENSVSQNVTIEANNLTGNIFPNDPAPLCEGSDINLEAPNGGVEWEWSNGSTNPIINVTESGVYKVTLLDENGCEYTPEAVAVEFFPAPIATIRAVQLNEFGQIVDYQEGGISACEGEAIFLEMVGQPKYTYEWSDGSTGEQLTLSAQNDNLLQAGSHAFSVTVTDTETGCTSVEGPFPVTINGAPTEVTITSSPEAPICEGTEVTFSVVNPQPDLAYLWNTGQTGHSIDAVSAGIYLVQAVNSFGCSARSEGIEINTAPPIGAMPKGCFTSCDPIEVCLPEIPDLAEIQWFIDGEAVPAPDGNSSEWTTDQSGEYSVHLTSIFGCETLAEGLSLDIAPQSGDLFGQVWVDVNENGQIDPNVDTLLSGAFVEIFQNNQLLGFQLTPEDGAYFFENFQVGEYVLNLNLVGLPQFQVVGQGNFTTQLSGCSFDEGVDFLVESICVDPIFETLELTACPNGTATFGGMEIPVGGSEDFTFSSFTGCDSILTVNVSPLQTSEGNLELSACPNGTAEFMGVQIPVGTSETFTLENYLGCDSTLTVSVSELPTSFGQLEISTCPGVPVIYGGQTMMPGDTEEFILENYQGCDSVLTVSVNSVEGDTTFLELEVCYEETTEYNGVTLSANDNETFVFESYLGCDSVVQVNVVGLPELMFEVSADEICHGSADGIINVNILNGTPPFTCSLDGQNFQTKPDFVDLIGGSYTVWVQDVEGCIGSTEINIYELPPLKVLVDNYVLPCDEEIVVIQPVVTSHAGELKWEWANGSHQHFCPVEKAGMYAFSVEDDCNIESREVAVERGDNVPEDFLYIPNAFSPNEDSVNDIFKTYAPENAEIEHFEFRIFDRWGALLFESFDQKEGWNGYMDGDLMSTGVYVWYVRATIEYCGEKQEIFWEGDVNLLR